jgi:hypothetical protein
MTTLAITVKNKQQEKLFFDLAKELNIEIYEAKFKSLNTKQVALGIGRKFNNSELQEYVLRNSGGKTKSVLKVKRDLEKRLAANNGSK